MREWTGFKGGIEIIGEWVGESERAVHLTIYSIDGEAIDEVRKWIPKSQIEASSKNGTDYKCIVQSWLGNKLLEELT